MRHPLQASSPSSDIIGSVAPDFLWVPYDLVTIFANVVSVEPATVTSSFFTTFYVPLAITITRMTAYCSLAVAGSHFFIGLYNSSRTSLLGQATLSTAVANVATQGLLASALTLTRGWYTLAWATDNVANAIYGVNGIAQAAAVFNATNTKQGSSTSLQVGGIMPASLAGITPNPEKTPCILLEP
jgi:hypothetical protein